MKAEYAPAGGGEHFVNLVTAKSALDIMVPESIESGAIEAVEEIHGEAGQQAAEVFLSGERISSHHD